MRSRRIFLLTAAATTVLGVAGWAGSQWAPHAASAAPVPTAQRVDLGESLRPIGAPGGERPLRSIGPGQTAAIARGSWTVEEATDIHRAANRGTRPVVVLLATLRPLGSPPSIPVR